MDYHSIVEIILALACCLNSIACIFNAKALRLMRSKR